MPEVARVAEPRRGAQHGRGERLERRPRSGTGLRETLGPGGRRPLSGQRIADLRGVLSDQLDGSVQALEIGLEVGIGHGLKLPTRYAEETWTDVLTRRPASPVAPR